LFAAEKNSNPKMAIEKKIFPTFFLSSHFFLLVSIAKFLKFYDKKRNKGKKYLLTVQENGGKWPFVILFALVILTLVVCNTDLICQCALNR
jgi:hypothetical protein